jgi:predicted phosphoribosyltransferase
LGKPIIPILVHKVPSSINEEFAIGAISVAGEMLLNEYAQGEKREYIDKIKKEMLLKLSERQDFFGVKCNFEDVKGKEVLIVDDGIATGETIYLAVLSVKRYEPSRTVVAVPVSSLEGYERMSQLGEVICPIVDRYFYAVSEYYEEFGQLSDIEARRYIEESLKFGE